MNLPYLPTNLSAVLADLAYLAVPVVVTAVVAWWRKHRPAVARWFQAHTTLQERTILEGLARDAVQYAEQFASSPAGAAKRQQALAYVQQALKARGWSIDVQEILGAIQSAYAAAKTAGTLAASAQAVPTLK